MHLLQKQAGVSINAKNNGKVEGGINIRVRGAASGKWGLHKPLLCFRWYSFNRIQQVIIGGYVIDAQTKSIY